MAGFKDRSESPGPFAPPVDSKKSGPFEHAAVAFEAPDPRIAAHPSLEPAGRQSLSPDSARFRAGRSEACRRRRTIEPASRRRKKRMRTLAEFVIVFFAKLLNPNALHVCRFEPSCSIYARQAWRCHSLPVAFSLILLRLWRCRPFGPYGYDPVPIRHKTHPR